jgi:hypothetical protein
MKNLQLLKRVEIDVQRWDSCINSAPNGLIYATTRYLDSVSSSWKGLVYGDYELVMPVPYSRFLWFSLAQQPFFMQQLGVFGKNISTEVLIEMIAILKKHFTYGNLHLNYANQLKNTKEKTNLILPLSQSYLNIRERYTKDVKNNLHVSQRFLLQYTSSNHYAKALNLFKDLYHYRFKKVKNRHFDGVLRYLNHYPDAALVREVHLGGVLQASLLAIKDDKRMYILFSATTMAGRKSKANHYLFDQLIQEFSGKPIILDFEGSEIEGVAYFYTNFGAVLQPYYAIHWNNLPWWLQLIKK